MAMLAPATLDLDTATIFATEDEEDHLELLRALQSRKHSLDTEQQRFRQWCDRADLLYYAEDFTVGGADHWAAHPSARTPGKSHVSVNSPASYVDIPAALQATTPIENILASEDSDESRQAAAGIERIYTAWKDADDFELTFSRACTVKALYGRAAVKVFWDKDEDRPCVELIDQPRNLYLGWNTTNYRKLDWAVYGFRITPTEAVAEYGVDVTGREYGDRLYPYVVRPMNGSPEWYAGGASRSWLSLGPAMIECWDYWYRKAKDGATMTLGEETPMETWNAVFIGNVLVIHAAHPEYDGQMPYLPLFNSYIPGVPDGKPELYDIEQLIREKDERITAGAQLISSTVAGQFWQLVGPEAPDKVPAAAKPKLNEVVAPGAGNRIEALSPFIPTFQLEQFLGRIDRELAGISGLNDLLLGLTPASVLSSSKAINALIANYEARISIKRGILYKWRKDVWSLVTTIWKRKNTTLRDLLQSGYVLDLRDPSLSPRDDLETATMALNLVNGKLWSMERGMDHTGVDDPEQEMNIIREEQTDATLNPTAVAVMAQLMSTLAALQQQAPPAAQQQSDQQLAQLQDNFRQMNAVPQGDQGMQGPEMQGQLPPEAQTPQPGGLPSGPTPPPLTEGNAGLQEPPPQLQSMIQGGQVKSRIVSKRNVPQRGG